MINPIIKIKVKNNIPFSAKDILKIIRELENQDSQKNKKMKDTKTYIYKNFSKIIENMQAEKIIMMLQDMMHIEDEEFTNLVKSNIGLIAKVICDQSKSLSNVAFRIEAIPKKYLDGVSEKLFQGIDTKRFDIYEMFEKYSWFQTDFPNVFMQESLARDKLAYYHSLDIIQHILNKNMPKEERDNILTKIMKITDKPLYVLQNLERNYKESQNMRLILNERKEAIIDELMGENDNEENKQLVSLVIDDILKNEKCQLSDIKYIDEGRIFKSISNRRKSYKNRNATRKI